MPGISAASWQLPSLPAADARSTWPSTHAPLLSPQHMVSACTAAALPPPCPRYLLPRPLRILFFGGSAASCLIAALLSAVRLVKVGAAACYVLRARRHQSYVPGGSCQVLGASIA